MLKWLVVPNQRCHIDRDVGVVVNQRFTETGCGSPHRFEKHKCAGHGCGRAVITVVDFRHQVLMKNGNLFEVAVFHLVRGSLLLALLAAFFGLLDWPCNNQLFLLYYRLATPD